MDTFTSTLLKLKAQAEKNLSEMNRMLEDANAMLKGKKKRDGR